MKYYIATRKHGFNLYVAKKPDPDNTMLSSESKVQNICRKMIPCFIQVSKHGTMLYTVCQYMDVQWRCKEDWGRVEFITVVTLGRKGREQVSGVRTWGVWALSCFTPFWERSEVSWKMEAFVHLGWQAHRFFQRFCFVSLKIGRSGNTLPHPLLPRLSSPLLLFIRDEGSPTNHGRSFLADLLILSPRECLFFPWLLVLSRNLASLEFLLNF